MAIFEVRRPKLAQNDPFGPIISLKNKFCGLHDMPKLGIPNVYPYSIWLKRQRNLISCLTRISEVSNEVLSVVHLQSRGFQTSQ